MKNLEMMGYNLNYNCKTVAILSGKGGTGKSQISVSIGYTLSHCGYKTLLIDLDLFTHGMTFYSLANILDKPKYNLMDCIERKCNPNELSPVKLKNEFCDKNLHVLPNINRKRNYQAELSINGNYSNLETFSKRLKEVIDHFKTSFHYIIIDTRGGTDFTTIAATKCADGHIIVTEADKPSWDTGRVLIDSILEHNENTYSTLGFVINKNVLPSEAIEAFLRREWETSHLATINLDPFAVKCFQEDKVPISEAIDSDFSYGVLQIIKKAFVSDLWSEINERKLNMLIESAEKQKRRKRINEKFRKQSEQFSFIFRTYVLIGLFGSLLYISMKGTQNISNYLFENELTQILLIFFFVFTFLIDPFFINKVIRFKEKIQMSNIKEKKNNY